MPPNLPDEPSESSAIAAGAPIMGRAHTLNVTDRSPGCHAIVTSRRQTVRMGYRTVWISDLHLGTRGCDAPGVLEFLRTTEFDRLYLVGDVVDLWRLRRELAARAAGRADLREVGF